MKNQAIASKAIASKESPLVPERREIDQSKQVMFAERHNRFTTIAEKLANDKFFYLNWYVPGLQDKYLWQPRLWTVGKYFPHAEGGPLLVDEPTFHWQIEECRTKAEHIKALGFRYIMITPDMDFAVALSLLNDIGGSHGTLDANNSHK
jgi:hypothetical protein